MTEKEYKIQYVLYGMIGGLAILLTAFSFFAVSVVSSDKSSSEIITQRQTEIVYDEFQTRQNINRALESKEKLYFHTVGFYASITHNQEIAETIIEKSIEYQIPVNIAFALAFVESSFNPEAEQQNDNSSIDRGLFQINSQYFDGINWFDIEDNTDHALQYLRQQYERFNSWEAAVLLYNAGNPDSVSAHNLRHMNRVLQKERELDVRYNTFRRDSNLSYSSDDEE